MSIAAVLLLCAVSAVPAAGTLTGRVFDENGEPLAGALVDLSTAKPRVGLAVTCPSCYRDCAKSATTDAEGRFSIGELDPTLLFRVLVLATGRRAVLTKLTDPAETELEVKLEPLPAALPPDRMLKGRVFDELGKPLAGAVVSPTGAKTHEKRWWGQLPGVDEAAVTDAEGQFVITSQEPKLGLDLRAGAPGYADFPSRLFDLDGSEHEIRMRRGATVSARLTYQGRPVKRRAIGMVQRDRSVGHFVGETTMATDDDGNFLFANLQPNERYVLYSLCDASQDLPVFKTVSMETGGDGEVTSLAEISLLQGLTLTGRVELPTGATMPKGAKLRVSRDPAWDWCETLLSDDGEFKIRSLPPEVYSVSVIAPGFEIDASRMRYQVTGASEFGLRLRGDDETGLLSVAVPMKSVIAGVR
ncbi:MAG TPA: carboxypeptidase-like regulatory domain-containing protein [Pirellulales bacterium]|nr:carboxypeptidase-like regulatory domain-containing protein [Pirellulales bacterium]